MSANMEMCMEMYGNINEQHMAMPKCACVACNSCTCGCSCRIVPDFENGEFEW